MEWMKLTDVCDINDKSVQEFEGLKEYVATGDIDFNNIVTSETITYNNKPSRANREVSNGDIIFAKMKGTIKVFKITEEVSDKYIFSTGFTTLKVKLNKLTQDYLYYVLISDTFQNQKDKYSSGATQKAINNTNLKKIKIPVPSLAIQEQIVEVLDRAQELIDKRRAQIQAMDSLIESIFYTMFGDPVRNEKGWEVKRIDNLGKVGSSRRVYLSECVDEGIPFYRGQEISKLSYGKKPENELFITLEHYKKLKNQRGVPKKGDLLLPSICPDGDIWMVDTDEPFYFKDGRVLWIELEDENINHFFIKTTLAYVLKKNFAGISSGSTFSELKIFLLESITIPIPPLDLQNEFAQKVELIEREKEVLEESLELMEENYRSIMDRAFKGELFN